MELVVIFGPGAVGKMTVGRALCRLTGYRLFHNHMTVDAVAGIFDFGSGSYSRLVAEFRRRVIEEAVASELPGLVFTMVWDLDDPHDAAYLSTLAAPVEQAGGQVRFVELRADQATRLEREGTPERLRYKPGKADVERSRQITAKMDDRARLNTRSGELLDVGGRMRVVSARVDTTRHTPEEAAEQIAERLGIGPYADRARTRV